MHIVFINILTHNNRFHILRPKKSNVLSFFFILILLFILFYPYPSYPSYPFFYPCFFAILGNPSKQFENLNTDRFYKGYGRVSNYNTNIINTLTINTELKHLKRVAKIEKFIINEINIEWCKKLKKENLDQFDYDIWENLEYWDNFENFKKNIIPYQNYKELETSQSYGFHPIYYVNCLI